MRTEDIFTLMDADEFAAYLRSVQVPRAILRLQNHHTYIPGYAHFTRTNHFSLLRSMRRNHMEQRGWSNIGQSLTTFPDGTIALCRPLRDTPAAIKGANTGSIAMEHVGWFDAGKDQMTDAHKEIIIRANALLCQRFALSPSTETIVYHHWYDLVTGKRTNGTGSTKSCPGTAFFGGNTVAAAQAGFIPLVQAALGELQNAPAPAPPLSAIGDGTVNADVLNVREQPTTSSAIVRRLRRGDRVEWYALSSPHGTMPWIRIDADREEWVAQRFINPA
jgi:hypothetical protein